MRRIGRRGVYSERVRSRVVPAQYYKNPHELEEYHRYNDFLQDLNLEYPDHDPRANNTTYKGNLLRLERLVLYKFKEDHAIDPPESAWFGWYDAGPAEDLGKLRVVPVEHSRLYHRLGLKELHERKALVLREAPGRHMQITPQTLKQIAKDLQ